jgi:hypothetical protein
MKNEEFERKWKELKDNYPNYDIAVNLKKYNSSIVVTSYKWFNSEFIKVYNNMTFVGYINIRGIKELNLIEGKKLEGGE